MTLPTPTMSKDSNTVTTSRECHDTAHRERATIPRIQSSLPASCPHTAQGAIPSAQAGKAMLLTAFQGIPPQQKVLYCKATPCVAAIQGNQPGCPLARGTPLAAASAPGPAPSRWPLGPPSRPHLEASIDSVIALLVDGLHKLLLGGRPAAAELGGALQEGLQGQGKARGLGVWQ